jgi:hypothetical protein
MAGRLVAERDVLKGLLWSWQLQEPQLPLRVTDPEQYFWQLKCKVHVQLCTVQAVVKQLANHACLRCDRCNRSLHQTHRSKFEEYAWAQLHYTLEQAAVKQFMSQRIPSLHGRYLGYVVEAKVLRKHFGAADIYIPALDLIIQVDGQHHESPLQMSRDARFDAEAHFQGRALLRLHYLDECAFHKIIPAAVQMCMERCLNVTSQACLMYTKSHPQNVRPAGSVTM